jgi:hypothetical protein
MRAGSIRPPWRAPQPESVGNVEGELTFRTAGEMPYASSARLNRALRRTIGVEAHHARMIGGSIRALTCSTQRFHLDFASLSSSIRGPRLTKEV